LRSVLTSVRHLPHRCVTASLGLLDKWKLTSAN
jgi:hypothetical protein